MLGEQTKQQPSDSANAQQESNQVRAPSISLPKGGGAIRGMGDKFAANPVTGTGSMLVPIASSPGRAGFGPHSLSYNSGSDNGLFGFFWSLSLTIISRKTDKESASLFGERWRSDSYFHEKATANQATDAGSLTTTVFDKTSLENSHQRVASGWPK